MFSVSLVSAYAHVFILYSVVIVTLTLIEEWKVISVIAHK